MKLNKLAIVAALGLALSSASCFAATAAEMAHIATSGSASIEAVPDRAILTVQVHATAKDAANAKTQVDTRVANYFDFLTKNGIDKKDIDAANISTQPEYDYKDGKPTLKGYQASRTVRIVLGQLDKLNGLLDGALKANLNEITAVEFDVAKPEVYQEQARQAAIKNAINQAESLAKGFGVKLGKVYRVRYHTENDQPSRPVPRMYLAEATAKTTHQQTYQQQSIHFDDQVDVIFTVSE